ncbi:hypothetical protein CN203_30740 [Sinorhizobium meliloti]|uniref:hypothetical protein n=1 Tax=Rhizobium meliloti TaxID=382 RepID=UPI000FDA72D0|nr:hypothetical protein [Sinorhizobium meliloti]RVH71116.1 hypothetical protein CN203_30740 [Sinorhizobium meliloti]
MAKTDKRPFRRPPPLVSGSLDNIRFDCILCRQSSRVNWYWPQWFPKESIPSNHRGYWVPIDFQNQCEHCQFPVRITAPLRDVKYRLNFHGDEAERHFRKNEERYYYYCYALAAISPNKRSKILEEITLLEQRATQMSKGRVSTLHAKDIMTDKLWPHDLPKSLRVKLIRDACKVIAVKEVSKFVFAGAARWSLVADQRRVRDELFSASFLYVLGFCTAQGIMPHFTFDLVKNNQKNGWAEECIRGIRYQPSFVWYSGRNHVPEPEFAKGASTLEGKVADILAYVTAREFDKTQSGDFVDVDSSLFGKAHFAGFDGNGDLQYGSGKGFPLRRVFGI